MLRQSWAPLDCSDQNMMKPQRVGGLFLSTSCELALGWFVVYYENVAPKLSDVF